MLVGYRDEIFYNDEDIELKEKIYYAAFIILIIIVVFSFFGIIRLNEKLGLILVTVLVLAGILREQIIYGFDTKPMSQFQTYLTGSTVLLLVLVLLSP